MSLALGDDAVMLMFEAFQLRAQVRDSALRALVLFSIFSFLFFLGLAQLHERDGLINAGTRPNTYSLLFATFGILQVVATHKHRTLDTPFSRSLSERLVLVALYEALLLRLLAFVIYLL